MRAACAKFASLCDAARVRCDGGFELAYETSVPRQVGLSGSSAIVVGTLRCLLAYHGLDARALGLAEAHMPQVVLDVESRELGIAAGLQDRVIQWYATDAWVGDEAEALSLRYATDADAPASLVHMDLGTALLSGPDGHGSYTRLPVGELPPLYLAYDGRLARLGADHPDTVTAHGNLQACLTELKRKRKR